MIDGNGDTHRTSERVIDNGFDETGVTSSFDPVAKRYPFLGTDRRMTTIEGNPAGSFVQTVRALTLATKGKGPAYASHVDEVRYDPTGEISHIEADFTLDDVGNTTHHVECAHNVSAASGATPASKLCLDTTTDFVPQRRFKTHEVVTASYVGDSGVTSDVRTRVRAFTYDGAALKTSSVAPDGADTTHQRLVTTYTHDSFGNVTALTTQDSYGAPRKACISYSPAGMFPFAVVNGLGHTTYEAYDQALGVKTAALDANGGLATWTYDSFGRMSSEQLPTGMSRTVSRARQKNPGGLWETWYGQRNAAGHTDFTVLGSTAKPIRSLATLPFDAYATRELGYDQLGERVVRATVPHLIGTAAKPEEISHFAFDDAGRPTSQQAAGQGVWTNQYSGRTQRTTDPLGHLKISYYDGFGRLIQVVDDAGTTAYEYTSFGDVSRIVAPDGTATVVETDAYGRVMSRTTPDAGTTTFERSGYGDVVKETNALHSTSVSYDILGRPRTRTSTEGASSWTWDTGSNGVGRLASMVEPGGNREDYTYDAAGRPIDTASLISGTTYHVKRAWDALGRLRTVEYPASADGPFRVRYDFDAHEGSVVDVVDDIAGTPYWTLKATDAAGRTAQELFPNNLSTYRTYFPDGKPLSIITALRSAYVQELFYQYDAANNLASRSDAVENEMESFSYDNLNRLTDVKDAQKVTTFHYAYAPSGNLTSKSGVGTLGYEDAAHPHAVTRLTTTAGAELYAYDALGNQTGRKGATVSYTSFGAPAQAVAAVTSTYGYDAGHRRVSKTNSLGSTRYVGGLYEHVKHTISDDHRYYVSSPDRVVAVVHRTTGADRLGTPIHTVQKLYVHDERSGSTDVLSDGNAAVVERRSYDAFGTRRNPLWSSTVPPPAESDPLGFIGGEDEPDLGWIHLGARMYDPRLGRFLQPDPVRRRPTAPQSLNGYSYADNNPSTLSDPSGMDPGDNGCLGLETLCGPTVPSLASLSFGGGAGGFSISFGSSAGRSGLGIPSGVRLPLTPPSTFGGLTGPALPLPPITTPSTGFPHQPIKLLTPEPWWEVAFVRNGELMSRAALESAAWLEVGAVAGYALAASGIVAGIGEVGVLARGAIGAIGGLARSSLARVVAGVGVGKAGELASEVGPEAEEVVAAEVESVGLSLFRSFCFPAGTGVVMEDGSVRSIEDVEQGDVVLAADPAEGSVPRGHEVTQLHRSMTSRLIHISVVGEMSELLVTGSHPFWTQRGWVVAEDLSDKDALMDHRGRAVGIEHISDEVRDVPTYNLSVGGVHTYFVNAGTTSILVHNVDPWDILHTQPTYGSTFSTGPWAGRSLAEAAAEARALGRLPEGLVLNVARVNGEWAALNNRTLAVARMANLAEVAIVDAKASGFNKLDELLRNSGLVSPVREAIMRCK